MDVLLFKIIDFYMLACVTGLGGGIGVINYYYYYYYYYYSALQYIPISQYMLFDLGM